VLTGADVREWAQPFPVSAEKPGLYYPCAIDKVRYVGEPVAVVVATDRYLAEDAQRAVVVEYQPLPAVASIEAAIAPGAALLHEEHGTNVAIDRLLEFGDVDAAFAKAGITLSRRYVFPRYVSFPLEGYGVIAAYNRAEEQATIWANFHGPYSMLTVLAAGLRMPISKLRVITSPDIGGSFGNKIVLYPYMGLITLASRKAGVPVKWIEDRMESLSGSSCAADRITDIEVAATREGEILAMKMVLKDNVGAYIRAPEPGCLFRPIGNYVSAYRFQNLRVRAVAVMTNMCPSGPNRGYGCGQHYFAMERIIDAMALELGMDPADVRMKNLIRPEQIPYQTPTGGLYDSGDFPAAFQKALDLSNYREIRSQTAASGLPDSGVWTGIGMAVAVDPSTSNMGYMDVSRKAAERKPSMFKTGSVETARAYLDATGGLTVELGTAAEGQGHETTAMEIFAEELGVPPSEIAVVGGMDTATRPWTVSSGTYASRFGTMGSSALVATARKLKENLVQMGAYFLKCPAEELRVEGGRVVHRDDPKRSLSIKDIGRRMHWSAGAMPPELATACNVQGVFSAADMTYPNEKDQVNSSAVYAFGVDIVVVEIDKETFDIRIKKYVSVHDAGNLLHPKLVKGQLAGAAMQGMAGALYEHLQYSETGDFLTGTLMDYLCPTLHEMPAEMISEYLIIPTPKTLSGAKGLGESTAQTAPIAIASAVDDALRRTGLEITALPITPSTLWERLSQLTAEKR
jgi:2-furoyl-CoA dehydrogenase large subunit